MNEKNKSTNTQKWANLSRSILNGIVGDYLDRTDNALAINMAFYHQNHALKLDNTFTEKLLKQPHNASTNHQISNKIIVLIHGLTNLESIWDFKNEQHESDDNYGRRLQAAYGFTPLYLRYNTGLSIKENGQNFSNLLNDLMLAYPIPIDEIVLMGFSMGGLIIRGAQKMAQENNAPWLEKLSNCYYIGTPHEGSPLEKFGHLTSAIVRSVPREYISHWADWLDIRSEGIRDLKDGLLHLKSDASTTDNEDDPYVQSVRCGTFTRSAQHHFISGAVSIKEDSFLNKLVGDSLVRHSSANPISAPEDCKSAHFDGISHVPLAHSEDVYQQVHSWFLEAHNEGRSSVALKYYEPLQSLPCDLTSSEQKDEPCDESDEISNQEIILATIDLLALAYERSVSAVEKVHHSIAEESFSILNKIPVVKAVSQPTQKVHNDILDTIYFSLKSGGKITHKSVKIFKPSKSK